MQLRVSMEILDWTESMEPMEVSGNPAAARAEPVQVESVACPRARVAREELEEPSVVMESLVAAVCALAERGAREASTPVPAPPARMVRRALQARTVLRAVRS